MVDERIYREFIDWFKMGWHLPETEELLPLLKARFSPEEAAFFTGMPFGPTRLEDIAEARHYFKDRQAGLERLARQRAEAAAQSDIAPESGA